MKASKFKLKRFHFKKFNPVQVEALEYFDKDLNLIVAAATSSGKTIVGEMFMADSIANKKKAVYLSPLKAVSQEKYDTWKADPDWSKLNISIVTGDYILTESRKRELARAKIVVLTSEMLDSRTRRIHVEKNDWLLEAGTLVVDESHLLTMKGRGDSLESAIMRFTEQNPNCRIVFLSATMKNMKELAAWLTKLNRKKTKIIDSDYRPCPLETHYVAYEDSGRYHEVEYRKAVKVLSIVEKFKEDKFLIFVHTKKMGRLIQELLDKSKIKSKFHSADLNLEKRLKIENDFRSNNSLRAIVATSTLAWGINMPARRVIVSGVHRGLDLVDGIDIQQEAGRAGRPGYDPAGDSYILLPKSKFLHYKNYCANLRPVTSRILNADILAFHIISEISEGAVYNEQSLLEWYQRSLAALQGQEIGLVEANQILQSLIDCEALKKSKKGAYYATGLGRVSAWFYFSPFDVYAWKRNFKYLLDENIPRNDVTLSWALGHIPANDSDFIPATLNAEIAEFKNGNPIIDRLPHRTDIVQILAYYFCMTGREHSNPFYPFVRQAWSDGERVCETLKLLDRFHAHWKLEHFFETLKYRIRYAVTEEQAELCRIKGIGGKKAKKLWEHGIQSIRQFVDEPKAGKLALGTKTYDKSRESALWLLDKYPQLAR